ncbi:MAG: DNA recombination protein RmuC, partial [Acidobacteria bacterium]|nr:DNA recombination protein RmuC [Acidobacteriota bacterium]
MSVSIDILIAALAGLLAGAAMAWFVARSRARQAVALAEASLQARVEQVEERSAGFERAVRERDADLQTARRALDAQAADLRVTGQERAGLEALLQAERLAARERVSDFERAGQALREAFTSLAAGALKDNSQAFLTLATTKFQEFRSEATTDLDGRRRSIDAVLEPMREKLGKVETTLAAVEEARREAFGGLKEQLEHLDRETGSLANALRAPHVRGRWGEVQLRRVVEMAGMEEHCDFSEQFSVTNEQGSQRPDMVVRLSGGRTIVIDAKAPLSAYQAAYEQTEPEARESKLREHAAQVREHVRRLASKAYWEQFPDAPDFVVLFLPAEPFFSTALQHDAELLEYGAANRVIPASPLTLLALLRTVALGWQQEKLARHAESIRDLGKELYERLCTMGDHVSGLGRKLNAAVESYNSTVASLEGRVLVSARKFKDLGVASTKELEAVETVEHVARQLQAADVAQPRAADAVDAVVIGEAT